MRLESDRKILIRGVEIGGAEIPICLPLVARTSRELLEQASQLRQAGADVIEWRVDAMQDDIDAKTCRKRLQELRREIGNIPLLFTLRAAAEGGMTPLEDGLRQELILEAVYSGDIDLVDLELASTGELLQLVREGAKEAGVSLILSSHDFEKTAREEVLLALLERAFSMGADIAKLAVTPRNWSDVIALFSTTEKARTSFARGPLITISMGALGRITRVAGGLFGSDMTFGAGASLSAPGQLPIDELKKLFPIIYQQPG